MMHRVGVVALVCLAGAAPCLAVDHVLPLGYENTQGTASFLGPLANSQRTYQLLIHADQLTPLVGTDLTGLAWRNLPSATVAWPTAEVNFSQYEVHLSESVPPADRQLNFAANVVGVQTQVRAGPLVIEPSAYPPGAPAPFGPTIGFDQPWHYGGGHLLVEIRHLGFTGTSRSVDAIGTSTAGYGTQFSACWIGTGATVMQGNFAVVRLTAEPASPCYANCDGSTVEPVLNVADFSCFLQRFAEGSALPPAQQVAHYANCDGSTTEPALNVADFSCFLQAFGAGCP